MEKRYQVFVSSTYADLKDERSKVLQTLMEMDCIPAGMEMFPAVDEEQFEFIKKIIDDCDYYLLIIGGKYGSLADDGFSYTEKEFDYAIEKGLKVVAFIHNSPDNIITGKSEQDLELKGKLSTFKEKVTDGRLVKFWNNASELPGLVALSLQKTIKMHPAIGWVRANGIASEKLLYEVNDLRNENAELKKRLSSDSKVSQFLVDEIDNIDSLFTVNGSYESYVRGNSLGKEIFNYDISWRKLFSLLAPYLLEHPNNGSVKLHVSSLIGELASGNSRWRSVKIDSKDFETISIQFMGYGFVRIDYLNTTLGSRALFWSITDCGKQFMFENRIIRKELQVL